MEYSLDLSAYDEKVDTGGYLTVIANKVTVLDGPEDVTWFVYRNIAAYINGTNFLVKSVQDVTHTANSSSFNLTLQDAHVAGNDWFADNALGTNIYKLTTADFGNTRYFFDEYGGSVLLNRDFADVGAGPQPPYYFEWKKEAADAMTLDAWTDSGKGTHIANFPLVITLDNDQAMPHFIYSGGTNSGNPDELHSGYIEDVFIDFGGSTERGPIRSPIGPPVPSSLFLPRKGAQ